MPPRLKSRIVLNLRDSLPLALLFPVLGLRSSSYYYARFASSRTNKYEQVRTQIHVISQQSGHTYGSPRIWMSLKREGITVSEKVVRRLMREENIEVHYATKRRYTYSSYIGEVSPAPGNLVHGNFHAARPNERWLTDVSEFPIAEGKVYLSPLIDFYDGHVVAWTRSRTPEGKMTDRMLLEVISTLSAEDRQALKDPNSSRTLVVHSDRGGDSRGRDWIHIEEENGITRSMFRNGNSGDNAACEGFFRRMKTEMFYGWRWETRAGLESAIDSYMDFYNNRRIKMTLGGLTIKEYRQQQEKLSKKAS